jgi:hypothetical protein
MESTPHLNEHFFLILFYRVHVESLWSPCGVHVPSSSGKTKKNCNSWSPHGVHVESMWSCGVHVESMRTLWGRVKYTFLLTKFCHRRLLTTFVKGRLTILNRSISNSISSYFIGNLAFIKTLSFLQPPSNKLQQKWPPILTLRCRWNDQVNFPASLLYPSQSVIMI